MSANIKRIDRATTSDDFLRTWGNPEQQYAITQPIRVYRYRRLWDLYQGTAFDNLRDWQAYSKAFSVYRGVRQVWDHVYQLVEFYATHIWSGSLAADGLTLPEGIPNAIPLAPDTDPTLAAAIAQLWIWWNMQETMTVIPRYTAALGELLVELKDDPTTGKVLLNLVWPGYVRDILLDDSGNVIEYEIAYKVLDESAGSVFEYSRRVTKEFIATFKDGEPFDYGREPIAPGTQPYGESVPGSGEGYVPFLPDDEAAGPGRIENPYGFVPAVWFRHVRTLGVRGEPAVWSTQGQLDEANSLFAHVLDKAHVSLEAPIVVSGNIAPAAMARALTNMVGSVKRTFTETFGRPVAERESLNILEGPQGTRIETIELKVGEAAEAMDRIFASIEKKCPEVTFYQQLRNMTQITGPGAQRVLGDVEHKFRSFAGGYDRNLIKLHQMGVSIAAMRYDEGALGWEKRTREQAKFSTFTETSYTDGKLDHTIMPRSVVTLTTSDRLEAAKLKASVFGDYVPKRQLALEIGYNEDLVDRWDKAAEQRAQEALAQRQAAAEAAVAAPARRPGAPAGGPQQGAATQNRTGRDRMVAATARVG